MCGIILCAPTSHHNPARILTEIGIVARCTRDATFPGAPSEPPSKWNDAWTGNPRPPPTFGWTWRGEPQCWIWGFLRAKNRLPGRSRPLVGDPCSIYAQAMFRPLLQWEHSEKRCTQPEPPFLPPSAVSTECGCLSAPFG